MVSHRQRTLSIKAGLGLGLAGTLVGLTILVLPTKHLDSPAKTLLLLLVFVCLWYFPHCPSHYAAGRLVGVRFKHYVIGPSALAEIMPQKTSRLIRLLPVLGLRIDRANSNASNTGIATMYLFGPSVSMIAPFATVISALTSGEWETSIVLTLLGLGNAAMTLFFSPKVGDIARALKALKA